MRLTTEEQAALAPLIAKFDAFWQTRTSSRSRMPLALWQEAALAAHQFKPEAVARALHVDVRSLRSHLGKKPTTCQEAPSAGLATSYPVAFPPNGRRFRPTILELRALT